MSFRIGLGEIVSTNRRKCKIEPPTLNICNSSLWNLMLAELPENLLLFKSSEMNSSLQLLLRWNNANERMIAGRSWLKKQLKLRQRSAFNLPFLSGTWICAARGATVLLLCQSLRLSLLGTLKTSFFWRKLYPQISPTFFAVRKRRHF